MAEEARDYGKTIPRGMGGGGGRRGRDLRVPARGRAVGDAGRGRRDACSPSRRRRAATPDDPILGVVENIDLGALQGPAEIYVGHPGRDDPVHRHERRADRRVAADLLDGPVPPAARGAAQAAPALPHARTSRSSCSGAVACLTIMPGPGRLPRHDLRLRRDAVVHDRPRGGDRAADQAARTRAAVDGARARSAIARARRCRCSRSSAALGTGHRVRGRDRARRPRCSISGVVWLAIGVTQLRALPAQPGAAAHRDRARW